MPEMNRRGFLVASSLTAAGLLWGSTRTAANAGDDGPVGAPFTLGIASGDPAPDGVVLWTRLAPAPFEPDGGMPQAPVEGTLQGGTHQQTRHLLPTGDAHPR